MESMFTRDKEKGAWTRWSLHYDMNMSNLRKLIMWKWYQYQSIMTLICAYADFSTDILITYSGKTIPHTWKQTLIMHVACMHATRLTFACRIKVQKSGVSLEKKKKNSTDEKFCFAITGSCIFFVFSVSMNWNRFFFI